MAFRDYNDILMPASDDTRSAACPPHVDMHGVFRWQYERNSMYLQHHLVTKCVQYFDTLRQESAQFVANNFQKECKRIDQLRKQGHVGVVAEDFAADGDSRPTRFTVLYFEKNESVRNEKLDLMSLERLQEYLVYSKWSKDWFRRFATDYLPQRELDTLGRVARDLIVAHRRMMLWNKDIHSEDDDLIPLGMRCLQDVCCSMMETACHQLLSQLSLFSDRVTIHEQSAHHATIRTIVRDALETSLVVVRLSGVADASELTFHSYGAVQTGRKKKQRAEEDDEEPETRDTKNRAGTERVVALETELRVMKERMGRDADDWKADLLDCVRQVSSQINFLQPTLDSLQRTGEDSLTTLNRIREKASLMATNASPPSVSHSNDGLADMLSSEFRNLIDAQAQLHEERQKLQPQQLRPVLDQLRAIGMQQEKLLEVLQRVDQSGVDQLRTLDTLRPAIEELAAPLKQLAEDRQSKQQFDPLPHIPPAAEPRVPMQLIEELADEAPAPVVIPADDPMPLPLPPPILPPTPHVFREQREGEPDEALF